MIAQAHNPLPSFLPMQQLIYSYPPAPALCSIVASLQPLSCSAFRQVLCSGNWAAADWLLRYGLVAASKQELVEGLVFEDARSGTAVVAELQWAVGMGGGQGQQEQVQWTPGLHAALRELLARCRRYGNKNAPARMDWLAELVAAAEEVVGGAPAVGADGVVEGV